jgi:hypothetical protein
MSRQQGRKKRLMFRTSEPGARQPPRNKTPDPDSGFFFFQPSRANDPNSLPPVRHFSPADLGVRVVFEMRGGGVKHAGEGGAEDERFIPRGDLL